MTHPRETMSSSPDMEAGAPYRRAAGEAVVWTDVDGKAWAVRVSQSQLFLRRDDETIELPADRWQRDLFVVPDGRRVMIRVETFRRTACFVLAKEDAEPLLAQLGDLGPSAGESDVGTPSPAPADAPLWPKVSPLAVWALILSSLVFIPWVGWGLAAASLLLLVLHRTRVRRVPAWRHSRMVCVAATTLLIVGLAVSVATIWCVRLPVTPGLGAHQAAAAKATGKESLLIVYGLLVVILALTVHEAAHAVSAWWLGDGLARSMGRVTLNPFAHIDPFGTVLLPLVLVWAGGPVFGYARPVPVRVETLPRYRRAHVLISLAGPGSNLLLAAASLMFLLATTCVVRIVWPEGLLLHVGTLDFRVPVTASGIPYASTVAAVCTLLKLSFTINVVLAVFNLIPIPPLDGSWIAEHLFPSGLGRVVAAARPYGIIIFIVAIYLGLFRYLMTPVWLLLEPGFALVQHVVGIR